MRACNLTAQASVRARSGASVRTPSTKSRFLSAARTFSSASMTVLVSSACVACARVQLMTLIARASGLACYVETTASKAVAQPLRCKEQMFTKGQVEAGQGYALLDFLMYNYIDLLPWTSLVT
eukprot:6207059-Pleurochrysis_carterae.AAC.1